MEMNKVIFVLVIMLAAGWLAAQSVAPEHIDALDLPVATTDNIFAPIVNPSLLGITDTGGFGYMHLYDQEKWQKHYWMLANAGGLAYVYEYDDGVNFHTLATGDQFLPDNIFPNVYLGTSYRWMNSDANKGAFRSGLTYRPHNSASLAFVLDHPFKAAPAYKAGFGVRPLAFVKSIKDYAFELSLDAAYQKNSDPADPDFGDYQMQKPTLGGKTQILDGLSLGAHYNLEDETAMLTFSLSGGKSELGSVGRMNKDEDRYVLSYLGVSDLSYKPIFGITPKTWYDMKLKGNIVTYRAPKFKIGPFSLFESDEKSIETVINEIRQAKNDPEVHGLLFKNPYFGTSFALQQELLDAMKDFKSSGKPVAFYYDSMTNGNYIFASAIADKIYLNKNGGVDLKGISISSPYFKELLDVLGIDVINFRSHEFKTAGNMFSEPEMTDAERLVYDSLLSDFYAGIIEQIGSGRGERLLKPVAQLVDEGPYWIAQDALDAGLVDKLIYLDELEEQLKIDFGYGRDMATLKDYKDYNWSRPKEHQIAVIYAQGNIVGGKGLPGKQIAAETTVDLIRKARNNPMYKGIILRVDSGGGSAFASDVILRELELAKTKNKKPVVVSMAGAAASGGYYIACKADKIVAEPGTITGSIGVVGIIPNAEKMFKKIKINWSTVKKGMRSDIGSMTRAMKDDEKAMVSKMIKNTYDDFISHVAEGRELEIEAVHKIAQGRVWTGSQAKDLGLVDELGGMETAKGIITSLANIKGKVSLIDATSSHKGIQITMDDEGFGIFAPLGALKDISSEYVQLYEFWKNYEDDPILMLSPLTGENIEQ